jgi:hypothetical protein
MEAGAIEVRLRTHEARIDANHNSISVLRDTTARHDTKIEVVTTELRETREDIADMKHALAEARSEQKAEMIWIRRGLWAAAGTFTLFVVAIATLVLQAAGS